MMAVRLTRLPKSEKPRKSREGKRSKRLKRQQQERKEKYRKRQCPANHEQRHELSKLSATHDVQHQRSGKKFHGGPPSARSLTLIEMCGCDCVLILASAVSECCGQKNSRCKPVPSGPVFTVQTNRSRRGDFGKRVQKAINVALQAS